MSAMADRFCAELTGGEQSISILVVSSNEEDRAHLKAILSLAKWRIHEAKSHGEMWKILQDHCIPIILYDRDVTDGGWEDALEEISVFDEFSPLLIVTARHPDDVFWADVLNRGGYDVLAKPFRKDEVLSVTSLAVFYWKEKSTSDTGPAGLKRVSQV
jgi:DNA-binding NtrC family response regulator